MDALTVKTAIFISVSAVIAYLSRHCLADTRSHGFYRFFAFEAILALILLNIGYWFDTPFSPVQIVSWTVLSASFFLAVHGLYLLIWRGKPAGWFENTTMLVKSGAYKWIRHPLYSSLLWLAWGSVLKDVSPISFALAVTASIFLFTAAKTEERENLEKFGAEYAEYMKLTKMFIPFLF